MAFSTAGLIALSATGVGAPDERNAGQLAAAVQAAKNGSSDANARIETNPNSGHQAVVSAVSTTWWNAAGHEFRTPTQGSAATQAVFLHYDFTNYTEDLGASGWAILAEFISPLAMIACILLLLRFLKKGNLPGMSLGRSRAREISAETTGVTFADVAGCEMAMVELAEIVEILRHPKRFAAIGARIPRGVILEGPPGTGKTLLARAVAGEAGAPFFSVSGSEFVELYVGVGASRVRDLFAQARAKAPAIIFVDEIDAVGRRRGSGTGHSNDEREQTLNQLLVEMDGIESSAPVIVIAATNRPDVLDPALLRPGRFDRRVTVELPDIKGRSAILSVHGHNMPFDSDVDFDVVARQTPGFSGADLANVVNEAALLAARHEATIITMAHVESACMRVIAGTERTSHLMSPAEREIVAHHEMGHALVGWVLEHADPVHKISIVSRGRALGWTMQLPEKDHILSSRHQLTDQLAGLLGGRAAEELIYGTDSVTSGAADDIERATGLAYRMVTQLGMGSLGLRAFPAVEPGEPRAYSETTAEAIDAEVDHLLEEAAGRARRVLRERRDLLVALATKLLDVETMDADAMREIIDRFPQADAPPQSVMPRGPRGRAPVMPDHWLVPAPRHAPDPVAAATAQSAAQRRPIGWRRHAASLLRALGSTPADG